MKNYVIILTENWYFRILPSNSRSHKLQSVLPFFSNFYQFYACLQIPWQCSVHIPYLLGRATHTTPAGRELDGVRDPTLAFSCTEPDLVPVLPARCHRCAGASFRSSFNRNFFIFRAILRKLGSNALKTNNVRQNKKRNWFLILRVEYTTNDSFFTTTN